MINPFKKTYSKAELEVFEFLSQVRFFARLKNLEMARLIPAIHYRMYRRDEVIFFRNDPSQAFYIVKKGWVSLNIDIKDNFESISDLRRGEAFGENSLLEGSKRIYSAIVLSEEAELMVIPSFAMHELFDSDPKIKAKMMTSLAEFYNENNHRLFKSYQSSFGFFKLGQMFEQR
ncbi:Crp/Fnr family transcriptional regulator [Pararhodonellum marinum]|uniref:Crp/Fnr family transcriptional regulator n=1 Tax=Pararhodonellum marinum TaxID=2755358 RepID=UPI00188E1D01|nr:cyclic nucleotide-binding domain-containing protein [Pararhodonellum marinum]